MVQKQEVECSGVVQNWIEIDLTPIPNFGKQNTMMVLNGVQGKLFKHHLIATRRYKFGFEGVNVKLKRDC